MAGSVIFLADLVRRLPIKLKTGPRSLRTAVLLRKPGKAPTDVPVDFVGFDIADTFVVGYGLDYDGLYRNLPYVAELRCQSGTTSCHQ